MPVAVSVACRRRLVLAFALCAGLLPAVASAGPPGFAFLEIPTGARSAAMGGALGSVITGAEAMFANPAAIEPAKGTEIAAGHMEYIQNLRHDYFSIAGRAWGGGLAASVRALYTEPIDERDENGALIGSFGAHDLEFAAGYAGAVSNALRLGATAKLVRERIANDAAQTYGFDFGATWMPASLPALRIGASAQNLGPAAHYDFEGAQGAPVGLPAAVQAGAAYALGLGRMNLRGALEARATRGRNAIGILGAELGDVSGAALRAGYRYNDDVQSFTLGVGYSTGALRLDYAFVPFKLDLGDSHRFSLTATF